MTHLQSAPWSGWIDAARVVDMHARALHQYGGRPGPADAEGCIDGALGAAFSAEIYLEGRKRAKAGLAFAGYALFYIVRRHCFVDGNKRAAWLAATDILATLGLGIAASDDEGFALMESVISHALDSGEDVAAWIAPRLFALDETMLDTD